jgi:hypothetical protein
MTNHANQLGSERAAERPKAAESARDEMNHIIRGET